MSRAPIQCSLWLCCFSVALHVLSTEIEVPLVRGCPMPTTILALSRPCMIPRMPQCAQRIGKRSYGRIGLCDRLGLAGYIACEVGHELQKLCMHAYWCGRVDWRVQRKVIAAKT